MFRLFLLCLPLAVAAYGQQTRWTCPNGEEISSREQGSRAVVQVDGRPLITLPRTISADGVRYSDGYTIFWTKGDSAQFLSGTVTVSECSRAQPGGRMTGMFTYRADAARFEDCATGAQYPVAMEGAYLAVERNYRNKQKEPGFPLYVTVEGHIASRPKADGQGREPTLIVERFVSSDPAKMCERPAGGLLTGRWKLDQLGGSPVTVKNAPSMDFSGERGRVSGSSGCNRFSGPYEANGTSLRFASLAMTRMACTDPEANRLEQAFVKMLNEVAGFRDEAGMLVLMNREGAPVARFVRN